MNNPLKKLLNQLKHDPELDQSQCLVSYRDFEGRSGIFKAPLVICEVESHNIRHGESIIPFHRITGVSYGPWILYPFGENSLTEKIIDSIKNASHDSADKSL